jgi:hypothetical protein
MQPVVGFMQIFMNGLYLSLAAVNGNVQVIGAETIQNQAQDAIGCIAAKLKEER